MAGRVETSMRWGLVGWMLGAEPARVVRLEGSWLCLCVSQSRQDRVFEGFVGVLSSLDDEACQDRAEWNISNLTLSILQLGKDRSPGIPNPIPGIRQLPAEIAQSRESVHVDIRRSLMLLPSHVALNVTRQRLPRGHH
jgi:hypothetical protein